MATRRFGRLRSFKRLGRSSAEVLERVDEIERRLAHLEAALEGLQDAVYRESVRRDEQTAELQQKTQPSQMARALSADERRRAL